MRQNQLKEIERAIQSAGAARHNINAMLLTDLSEQRECRGGPSEFGLGLGLQAQRSEQLLRIRAPGEQVVAVAVRGFVLR